MIKRVDIEIMAQDNKRVLQRYRIRPKQTVEGSHAFFTEKGVDAVLEGIIARIDAISPNHKFRLVSLGRGRFRFVWDEGEADDTSGD